MKEKLYTIPVNDAFDAGKECALCHMRNKLERNAIDFTMGNSYMEDDIRTVTSKLGFCKLHMKNLNEDENRLGLALILKSHLDKNIEDIEKLNKKSFPASKKSIFKKKSGEELEMVSHLNEIIGSCYICNTINETFGRYVATVFHLYKTSEEFRKKFKDCKGFCMEDYAILYENAHNYLKNEALEEFLKELNKLYLENIKRLRDDLDWFVTKFDYRYKDEPWKNSKDAIERTIIKTNSIMRNE